MRLEVIYANEDAQIEIDESKEFLQLTWFRQPSSESFQKILSMALNLTREKQLYRWLSDMRKIVYLLISDQNWLVENIYGALDPKEQHGIAYIVSKEDLELYTSFHIQDLVQENPQLNKKLLLEIFFEKTLALHWLMDQSTFSSN